MKHIGFSYIFIDTSDISVGVCCVFICLCRYLNVLIVTILKDETIYVHLFKLWKMLTIIF